MKEAMTLRVGGGEPSSPETVFRRTIVGVMGSGTVPHARLAVPLGKRLAASGFHLLTGAGGGVMAEVARAFCSTPDRMGLSIGILRSESEPVLDPVTGVRRFLPGEVNRWVEIPVVTHLPLSGREGTHWKSRNHINVLTADVLIALPGSEGTLSEIWLRVQYGRPVILLLGGETVQGQDERQLREQSAFPELVLTARTLQEIPLRIRQSLEIHDPWRGEHGAADPEREPGRRRR